MKANGCNLKSDNFSKFGALVEEQDILMEALTCREHLRFAA